MFEEDVYSGCAGGSYAFFLRERQFFTGIDISNSSSADNCRNHHSSHSGADYNTQAHHNTDHHKANYTADHHNTDNNYHYYHDNYHNDHDHNYHHAGDHYYTESHSGADHRREKTRAG